MTIRSGSYSAGKKMIFCWQFSFYRHYSLLLNAAVLLLGFSTGMAAPTDTKWWTNPCGIQTVQLRHGRSPAENQLRIFIKMIDNGVMKDLRALYPQVAQKQVKITNSCPRVNAILELMTNANNFTTATHIFYETMVELAKFIHKVKQVPVKTHAKFNAAKRKRMYEEVEYNLKSVMCEFNDTLSKFEPLQRNAIPLRAIRRSISSKCVRKPLDLAKAQILDIDLFNKLKKFFRQSRKILRQKKRRKNGKANQNNKKQRLSAKKNSKKLVNTLRTTKQQ